MGKKTNHRLFDFLDAIDTEEFYRLKRYIYADFFNTNERYKKLFDAIWAAKTNDLTYRTMNVERIYRKTFPKQNIKAMRDDFSGILKLVRGFIAQEEYQNDTNAKTRYLLRGLENRQAYHRFRLLINNESKNYENTEITRRNDARENYLHDLLIAEQKYRYYNIHENRKMATNELLQEFVDSIERFYAIIKIRFWSVMRQRAGLSGYRFRYGSMTEIKRIVAQTNSEHFPLLHIYYHIAELWDNRTPEIFDICKSLLLQYSERFSRYEQQNLFQSLINFCRVSVMSEQPRMWNLRQLDLYEQFFERGFCYTGRQQRKRQISLHHFKNYMQLLIELDEFEQFRDLQEQHAPQVSFKNKLEQRFVNQYNTTALYFAQYVFYRKKDRIIGQDFAYETALKHIQKIEQELITGAQAFPDVFYRILYEILLLKIYFEQPRGFTTRRNAFYKYVNSQKHIARFFLKPYLNFATIALKLHQMKHRENQDATDVEQLKNKLSQMQIVERVWLNEKLNQRLRTK